MDTRKWVTLMAGVLFLGASFPAEACRCLPFILQNSYCKSTAALKVKFLAPATRPVPGSQDVQKGYKVKVGEVFRGDVGLETLTFIDAQSGSSCDYTHPSAEFNKDYLIVASVTASGVSVRGCNYIASWDQLLIKLKKGVEGAYNQGCTCEIRPCYTKPCPMEPKTCTLEEYTGGDAETKLNNQVCAPINSTTCNWKNIE
ncbi:metalloproteinase inhibitor 1-like [Lissotriton helveticus]